ncbi:hypothetical protein PRIPAC_97028 [Pristionchus pacificus]|uniref:Uncharacterized protein n=1 Tax=Pristionchus pacificus TaxID=54126 RepID=A0A2A6BC12_PRIPA|nr:hypothetical protein PRIPAC_97028 [Pristionchus pacificus]|eukprot:PDM63381.1 hypothetical protein PRIPAC_53738 [Pristionchus pacificus]
MEDYWKTQIKSLVKSRMERPKDEWHFKKWKMSFDYIFNRIEWSLLKGVKIADLDGLEKERTQKIHTHLELWKAREYGSISDARNLLMEREEIKEKNSSASIVTSKVPTRMPRINREIRSADRDYDEKMAIFKSLNLPFLRRDNREEYLRLLGAETHIRLCYEHQSEFLYGIKGQQEKIDE